MGSEQPKDHVRSQSYLQKFGTDMGGKKKSKPWYFVWRVLFRVLICLWQTDADIKVTDSLNAINGDVISGVAFVFIFWCEPTKHAQLHGAHMYLHVPSWRYVPWKVHPWLEEMILQRQGLTLDSFLMLLAEQTLQDRITNSQVAGSTGWYLRWSGVTFLKIVKRKKTSNTRTK